MRRNSNHRVLAIAAKVQGRLMMPEVLRLASIFRIAFEALASVFRSASRGLPDLSPDAECSPQLIDIGLRRSFSGINWWGSIDCADAAAMKTNNASSARIGVS